MPDTTGYIKLYRSLLEWEWYSDAPAFRVFLHLLLKANHKSQKYKGTTISKGQHLTSREILAKETGLSIQQVRTALNKLKSTGEITIKSTKRGTVINVCNYCKYQSKEGLSNQDNNQQINQIATNNQPSINQRATINKNEKNDKNERSILCAFFESIWSLYPKKKGKGQISDSQKKKLLAIGHEQIKRCIERYMQDNSGTDSKFLQYGSTFFNSGYVDYLDENYSPSAEKSKYKELE